MTRIVGFVAGVIAWSVLVFAITFYLTFPSDALVKRIEKEAPRVLGPGYELSLASASPWWIGVSLSDVRIFQSARKWERSPEDEAETAEGELVAMVPRARVRTSLFSLISQAPTIKGALSIGDGGNLDFDVSTASGERQLDIASLAVEGDALPLADVLGNPFVANALGGTTIVVDHGEIDVDVDLTAGDNGMADGVGRVSLIGEDLLLSDIINEASGPLGMEIPIKKLEIIAEVDGGQGEIVEGVIESDLFHLEVEGEFALQDPLKTSTIDLKVTLSEISQDLAMMKMVLEQQLNATAENGMYKFACRGMLARLNSRTCRAEGRRRIPSVRTPPRGRNSRTRTPSTARTPRTGTSTDRSADNQRRREQIRERLKAQRDRDLDDYEGEEEDLEDPDEFEDEELLDEEFDEFEEE